MAVLDLIDEGDSRRCAHRFDDWSDEISNTKTGKIYVV
jgi:hypothetical protein